MYAAIDIGGTKTLVAVFSEDGSMTESIKFPTPVEYPAFLTELRKTVDALETKQFASAAVAAPGTINHETGELIAAANLPWRHVSVQSDVEHILNTTAVIENDAKVATLGEAYPLKDVYEKVVYITISTGIGIGVCVNGVLDHTLIEAEVGHMFIEVGDEMIPWEKVASGKAIVAKYNCRASDLNDPEAWDQIAHNLSKGFLSIIAIIQPDIILVGGGVGSHFAKFEAPLKKYLTKYENLLAPTPEIRMAEHPEEAVVYGCYQLARTIAS